MNHADDCEWQFEQYPWECTCGVLQKMDKPQRLREALKHINSAGNLKSMQDVTVPQLDRIWRYIQRQRLAVMNQDGLWDITDRGVLALSEDEHYDRDGYSSGSDGW